MKKLLILLLFGILSCEKIPKETKIKVERKETVAITSSNLLSIGEKIEGNFKGDGQIYFATAVKIKEGIGNPVEDGTSDQYEIQFSGNLPVINAGCCSIRLVNEGDLNNDGTDEISLFQAPMNGCTYSMTTYSLTKGNWKKVINEFMIATGCDEISDDDLQRRIFKEKDTIYYFEADPNDENQTLIKKKAKEL